MHLIDIPFFIMYYYPSIHSEWLLIILEQVVIDGRAEAQCGSMICRRNVQYPVPGETVGKGVL